MIHQLHLGTLSELRGNWDVDCSSSMSCDVSFVITDPESCRDKAGIQVKHAVAASSYLSCLVGSGGCCFKTCGCCEFRVPLLHLDQDTAEVVATLVNVAKELRGAFTPHLKGVKPVPQATTLHTIHLKPNYIVWGGRGVSNFASI
eukprot:4874781-Amphidinium_carterae.1